MYVMHFHFLWIQCWYCLVASYWHCIVASLSISMSPCSLPLGRDACITIPTLTYHDVLYIVESGCYINISVSEIHSDNCGNSTAHAQNIILSPNRTGLFLTYLGLRGRGQLSPSIFIVSEPVVTKFCTAIDHQSVSLNMKKIDKIQ